MDSNMAIRPWIEDQSPNRGLVAEPDSIKGSTRHSSMWQKIHRFWAKDESPDPASQNDTPQNGARLHSPGISDCSPRKVGVGLPRMGTFQRQNSERRDRLEPVECSPKARRAKSASRQRALSAFRPRSRSSPPPHVPARESAPVFPTSNISSISPKDNTSVSPTAEPEIPTSFLADPDEDYLKFSRSRSRSSSPSIDHLRHGEERAQLEAELDSKWILNLSMHFRDKSDREKFFVTYAETPNRWRRVTVSCDYRNAEEGSLEMDLKELQYQRDKSIQIYESIRDSLTEIQFYDSVTNLKLETSDGRLHVHVTEDVNEIIPYPPKSSVAHILNDLDFAPPEIKESDLTFDSHLSGFVYKVKYQDKHYIKKEIPGPDTVEEFLYEINALHALSDSKSVIQLEGIVVDDQYQSVKGILISFAEQGALVDMLYDNKGKISWDNRLRWARQAVQGLSEIHEEGYVQGDFTLSNIVIDSEHNAKIIDINRRGCPVGWEPPELAKKISSNQRISMYIGEKSDIYQLGMTLWALAMDEDEPERHDPPLLTEDFPLEIPRWYSDVVDTCLQTQPRNRLSAKDLLKLFPVEPARRVRPALPARGDTIKAAEKRYIEPSAAVEREDIERFGHPQPQHLQDDHTSRDSIDDPVFTNAPSSSYQFDSGSSYIDVTRGRRPGTNMTHIRAAHPRHQDSGVADIYLDDDDDDCDVEPQIVPISPRFENDYDEIKLDGVPYLVSRSSFDPEDLRVLDRRQNSRQASFEREMPRLEPIVSAPESGFYDFPNHSLGSNNDDTDIDLELETPSDHPGDVRRMSIASGSTPRHSTYILATSTPAAPPPPLDLSKSELVGFGGHPSLDEYSPHEPKLKSNFNLTDHQSPTEPPLKSSADFPFAHDAKEPNYDPQEVEEKKISNDHDTIKPVDLEASHNEDPTVKETPNTLHLESQSAVPVESRTSEP